MRLRLVALLLLTFAPIALAAGRANLQAFFQTTLQSADYQQKAFDKVASRWRQPAKKALPAFGKKTVVAAVIDAKGKLVSAEITMKSGSDAWDKAAVAAVKSAAPFPALPKGYPHPTVEAHFHVGWEK